MTKRDNHIFARHGLLLHRCDGCALKFLTKEILDAHLLRYHKKPCVLCCRDENCRVKFNWVGDRDRHYHVVHELKLEKDESFLRVD